MTHLCLQSQVLYTNIDQTLMNALHGLLNYDVGGSDSCYYTRV